MEGRQSMDPKHPFLPQAPAAAAPARLTPEEAAKLAAEEMERRRATLDPSMLATVFGAFAGTSLATARPLPRRRVSFFVDHTVCAPGVFAEDFELTLASLTPADELRAIAEAKGDSISMAFTMARHAMEAVNGSPIPPGVDEWLWSALDVGGRQLVTGMFAELTGTASGAAGKARRTLRVH